MAVGAARHFTRLPALDIPEQLYLGHFGMPGMTAYFGLLAAAVVLLAMTMRLWPVTMAVLSALWLWSALFWTTPMSAQGWVGVDTLFGGSNGRYGDYQQHLATIERVREKARAGASVIVLPESALGVWTPTIERLWTRALQDLDVTVYGGAVIVDETGYDNVMMEVSEQGRSVRYRQRMPVPVSMWQPWLGLLDAPAGARADFFANPVVVVSDVRVATLICYEQLLIWPILQSALSNPDILVAPSNGWWTSGTDIVAIQLVATMAWAKLFDLPLVIAVNR